MMDSLQSLVANRRSAPRAICIPYVCVIEQLFVSYKPLNMRAERYSLKRTHGERGHLPPPKHIPCSTAITGTGNCLTRGRDKIISGVQKQNIK